MDPYVVPDIEQLYAREAQVLARALCAMGASPDAASDAVQDAFVQAFRHWRRVQRYDNPAAWVRRAAINRVANQRRNSRRLVQFRRTQAPEVDHTADLDSVIAIRGVLQSLPPRRREAVALFYICDLPIREVALTMELSEGAVKAHLAAGRDQIRKAFEDDVV